jgi:hypothetical protein
LAALRLPHELLFDFTINFLAPTTSLTLVLSYGQVFMPAKRTVGLRHPRRSNGRRRLAHSQQGLVGIHLCLLFFFFFSFGHAPGYSARECTILAPLPALEKSDRTYL